MIRSYLHVTISISLSQCRVRVDISVISYLTQHDSKNIVLTQLYCSGSKLLIPPRVRLIGLSSLQNH